MEHKHPLSDIVKKSKTVWSAHLMAVNCYLVQAGDDWYLLDRKGMIQLMKQGGRAPWKP